MLNFDIQKYLEKEFTCKNSGNEIYFCCPFCKDKSWNYWFDPDKKYIHKTSKKEYKGLGQCWKCSKRHNVVTFIMEYKSFDLFQTLSFIRGERKTSTADLMSMLKQLENEEEFSFGNLFDEYHRDITIPFPPGSTTRLPEELVDWFTGTGYIENNGITIAKRSFPKELLKILGVRYCHYADEHPLENWKINQHEIYYATLKNRALLPIETNNSSAWQGYLYRPGINKKNDIPYPKTKNPPGDIMKNLLTFYNYSKDSDLVLINEGYFDGLRCISRGYNSVTLNGKNLSLTQAFLMSKMEAKEFCMCLDGGEKEFEKAKKNCGILQELVEAEISIMKLPNGLDPDDCPEKLFNKSFKNRFSFNSLKYKIDGQQSNVMYNNS